MNENLKEQGIETEELEIPYYSLHNSKQEIILFFRRSVY